MQEFAFQLKTHPFKFAQDDTLLDKVVIAVSFCVNLVECVLSSHGSCFTLDRRWVNIRAFDNDRNFETCHNRRLYAMTKHIRDSLAMYSVHYRTVDAMKMKNFDDTPVNE